MGTDGNLEQIERIQSSIDKSLARVKYGLSVQSDSLSTLNAVPGHLVGNPASSLPQRIGTGTAKLWGETSDSPVNRLLKLHRDMSTIRTTAQEFSFSLVFSRDRRDMRIELILAGVRLREPF